MLLSFKRWGLPTLAALAAFALGGWTFWRLTHGLTAFTSESWRQVQVLEQPRPLPDVTLQDQDGRLFNLHQWCGSVLAISFIYTQCQTVCGVLGAESVRLAEQLADLITTGRLKVVAISFDPQRDDPTRLARFQRNLYADATTRSWVVRAPSEADTRRLLATFGVTVIADGRGGFDHNAAFHVVDQSCRLVRIIDLQDVGSVAATVRALTQ